MAIFVRFIATFNPSKEGVSLRSSFIHFVKRVRVPVIHRVLAYLSLPYPSLTITLGLMAWKG